MNNLQTVDSIYDAFHRGDIPHITGLVAAGAPWGQPVTVPWGGDYTRPEGVKEFFGKLAASMETTKCETYENAESGGAIFSSGYYEGRSVKTGRTGGCRFLFHWTFDGRKMVRYRGYLDTAALLASMA